MGFFSSLFGTRTPSSTPPEAPTSPCKPAFDQGEAGVFTLSVADTIHALLTTYRQGSQESEG